MRRILCLSFLVVSCSMFGQLPQLLPNVTIDPSTIEPSDVPSEGTLRMLGASEEEIEHANAFREGELTLEGIIEGEGAEVPDSSASDSVQVETQTPTISSLPDLPEAKVYGHSFFRSGALKQSKPSNAKAPENYIVDVGDELNISVWGYSEYDGSYRVEQDGYVKPDGLGRIYVKGLTFAQSRSLIKKRLSAYLDVANSGFNVSLGYSRLITINIVGEVFYPGSYEISAVNTAFSVLAEAYGPTDLGSIRNIKVIRNGKVIKVLDFYQFLLNPQKAEDFFLQDGDFLFVPAYENHVSIAGAVKRPMLYEMNDKETVADVIRYSGGFNAKAVSSRIALFTYRDELRELDLIEAEKYSNTTTVDGDSIWVQHKSSEIIQMVQLVGAVNTPGNYPFDKEMEVADLIDLGNGLHYNAHLDHAYIIRTLPDLSLVYITFDLEEALADRDSESNQTLVTGDIVKVLDKAEFVEEHKVSIFGEVRTPGVYLYAADLTLGDLVNFAGGLSDHAAFNRIEISSIMEGSESIGFASPTRTVVKIVELDRGEFMTSADASYVLQPYDQVFVRTDVDFEEQRNVTVLGAVKYPGIYSLTDKRQRLSDVIARAGGLKNNAYAEGVKLYRYENNQGFSFTNLAKALEKPDSRFNYTLKHGDVIEVPEQTGFVSVGGAVRYPEIDSFEHVHAPHRDNKRANYYVKKFGAGYDRYAKKKWTYVRKPNGVVTYAKGFLFFRIHPKVPAGSTVMATYKPDKRERRRAKPERDPAVTQAIVTGIATSLTTILTSILLIRAIERQ